MKSFKQLMDEAGRCWPGHKPVPGKKPYSPGSCVKEEVELDEGLKNKVGAALTAAAVSASPHAHSISVPSFNMAPATYVTQIKPKQDQEASRKAGRAFPLSQKSKELMKKEEVEQYEADDGPLTEDQIKQLEEVAAWQRKEGKNPEGGLNRKGIESYRRGNPGSKLSMAVTTKPSKLKPGSKAANRRKSFCARMSGMKRRLTSAKTARDPDSRINKSLRKWNC